MTNSNKCPQCGAPVQVVYDGPDKRDRWLHCAHCSWKQDIPDHQGGAPDQMHSFVKEIHSADGSSITRIEMSSSSHVSFAHDQPIDCDQFIEQVRAAAGDHAAEEMRRHFQNLQDGTVAAGGSQDLADIPGLSDAERQEIVGFLNPEHSATAADERNYTGPAMQISCASVLIAFFFAIMLFIIALMVFGS